MAGSDQHSLFSVTTAWDRPVVPLEGGSSVLLAQIRAGQPPHLETQRPPMDIAFVLDRSGSMSGEPLALVKQAVIEALQLLDARDRVALISFDDHYRIWHQLAYATPEQKRMTQAMASQITPGGSTNLSRGWKRGCQQLAMYHLPHERRVRRVIVLTDGLANAGVTDPGQLAGFATEWRQQGIATSTIGVGHHYDEMLLSAIAEAGGGNYAHAEHLDDIRRIFIRETEDLSRVVAIAPTLQLTLQPGMYAELLNAFPYRIHGSDLRVDLRDLVAGDDLVLVLEVTVPPGPAASVVALTGSLRLQDGTIVPIGIASLQRQPRQMVVHHPVDPDVAREHAVERANKSRREAIRLDRAGDLAGSRQVLRDAQAFLQAAPMSAETAAMQQDFAHLAEQQVEFSEDIRKRLVHDAHSRSRGRHQR